MRRLITIVSAVSLVLCVATVALWVRSYRARDDLHSGAGRVGWTASSDHGRLAVTRTWPTPPMPEPLQAELAALDVPAGARLGWEVPMHRRERWSAAGVVWREVWLATDLMRPNHLHSRTVLVRYWLVLLLTGVLPACWLVWAVPRWQRRATLRRGGLCVSCGYDLRATPGRCPECGAVPAAGRSPPAV